MSVSIGDLQALVIAPNRDPLTCSALPAPRPPAELRSLWSKPKGMSASDGSAKDSLDPSVATVLHARLYMSGTLGSTVKMHRSKSMIRVEELVMGRASS